MKKTTTPIKAIASLFMVTATLIFASCGSGSGHSSNLQAKVDSLQNELTKLKSDQANSELRLAKFDTLDFDFYSNQKWEDFNHSHADTLNVIILMAA